MNNSQDYQDFFNSLTEADIEEEYGPAGPQGFIIYDLVEKMSDSMIEQALAYIDQGSVEEVYEINASSSFEAIFQNDSGPFTTTLEFTAYMEHVIAMYCDRCPDAHEANMCIHMQAAVLGIDIMTTAGVDRISGQELVRQRKEQFPR